MKPDRAEVPQSGIGGWAQPRRKKRHCDYERALAERTLPERPDYEAANRFLIKARWEMAKERPVRSVGTLHCFCPTACAMNFVYKP